MTVATFTQPDYTSQTGTAYPLNIDASLAVLKRSGDAFAPHAQSTPNMTIRVDAGMIFNGATLIEVAAQSTATISAPGSNPRIDRVVVNSLTGVASVLTGTPAGSPVAPAISAGQLPVCQVLVQTSSTAITNAMITDERVAQGGASIVVGGLGSIGRNITAKVNAGTPSSKIDIAADKLQLINANGGAVVVNTVSVTVDMAVSGANGLDAGSEASNTWYYGWVIYNPSTNTVAGLISTSATAPTLPSGYTYSALVTAVRNDGSSNFIRFSQLGDRVFLAPGSVLVLNSGGATTETSISLSSAIPPIASEMALQLQGDVAANGSGLCSGNIEVYPTAGQNGYPGSSILPFTIYGQTNGVASTVFCGHITTINQSQTLYYKWSGLNGTSPHLQIYLISYRLPIGGS